jgi:hypothetical protein
MTSSTPSSAARGVAPDLVDGPRQWPATGHRVGFGHGVAAIAEPDWAGVAVADLTRLALDEGNQELLDSPSISGG